MLSLIYVSTSNVLFSHDALNTLANEAAKRNAQVGITGLLVYNGFNFMQLLEGEAADVDQIMAAIKDDARHSGVVVIRREETSQRECPDWAMTVRTTPPGGLAPIGEALSAFPDTFREESHTLFRSFASLVR